jgi:molybdopterin-binding protein
VGDVVQCNFQEASVCVSKDCPGHVSIENKVPGVLKETRSSDLLCELSFDSAIGKIVSLISSQSYDDLQLEQGSEATILIRGIDISLEPVIDIYKTHELRDVLARTKDAN